MNLELSSIGLGLPKCQNVTLETSSDIVLGL